MDHASGQIVYAGTAQPGQLRVVQGVV
jgi:hypothetical protein